MIRVTEFHPVQASDPAGFPGQSPTLIPTRTVPAGINWQNLAVTCNVSCSVYVGVCLAVVCSDVSNTINGVWSYTFHIVEGEVPALTAVETVSYSVVTIELHFQSCFMTILDKNAFLKAKK